MADYLSPDCNHVRTEALAEALRRTNLHLSEVARRMNYGTTDRPDTSRVQRVAGLRAQRGKHRQWVTYEEAVQFIRAAEADPVDFGL